MPMSKEPRRTGRNPGAEAGLWLGAMALLTLVVVLPRTILAGETKFDSDTLGNLTARAIGPAVMGGRIAAIDAYATDRLTVYVGAAGGGVWKSLNGGETFKPVFEDHPQSIGAIRIDPS